MKKIIWAVICLIHYSHTHAQIYKIPITPLLRHLYYSKNDICSISNTSLESFLPEFNNKYKSYQKLIKTKSGLYIMIDGTGKVFRAIEIDNNFISFSRIDITRYFGNTFYSIDFAYHDTLFSFGGYGFWHMNGQLRRFNTDKEWSIEKVYKIRHTIDFIYNYISKKNKLFYIEQPINDEETFFQKTEYTALEFDIKKKKNNVLGQVNNNIKLGLNIMIDLPNLNGTLINSDRDFLLLDMEHNKVLKLKNKKIIEALIDKSGTTIQNTFEEGNRIYFTNYPDTNLKSIPISINDFKEEPYNIYEDSIQSNSKIIIGIGILIILYVVLKRRRNKINLQKHELIKIDDPYSNDFTLIEKTLIEKLIEKSKNGSYFTVDDINNYLGTKKKAIEVQKSIRTESINRINHKFKINCDSNATLIQRVRSIDDARFMNYKISEDNIVSYSKYLKKNSR